MKEAERIPTPPIERERATLLRRVGLEGRFSVWIAGIASVGAIASVLLRTYALATCWRTLRARMRLETEAS